MARVLLSTLDESLIRESESQEKVNNLSPLGVSQGQATMKPEYDLSKMKARKNPYASKLKKTAAKTDSWNDLLQPSRDLAVDGLPPELSVNLDHYLHGAPKRESSS